MLAIVTANRSNSCSNHVRLPPPGRTPEPHLGGRAPRLPGRTAQRDVHAPPLVQWLHSDPLCGRVWPPGWEDPRGPRGRDVRGRWRHGDGADHLQHAPAPALVGELRGAGGDGSRGAAMPELLALLPLVQLPNGAVPVCPALLARHLQVAGSVLRVLVVTRQVAGRRRGAPRGVPGALGKSLVVFREGQGLAGTMARKGLVRGQAEEKGGQVR